MKEESPDVPAPKISIVMAAYNEEHVIGRALDSIIEQTFIDWELVVIDDGSIDTTADIVRRYADKDRRIRLVRNESNLRLPASLNKGVNLANADLIARADADDVNLPDRLARQYDYMQLHHEIDVLGTGAYLLDQTGCRVKSVSMPPTHAKLKEQAFLKTLFFHPSVMIRRRFFDSVGQYDGQYLCAEDRELWLRGLHAGCCYANLPEPLIEYNARGFTRSWRSLIHSKLSLFRMARKYKIKRGYIKVLLSFAHGAAINMRIYTPRSLRVRGGGR